jgi:Uma2 family endonuclease
MAETQRVEMTADEFLIWCLSQEERYELVDGVVVPLRAMSGASAVHDQIAVNVIASMHQQLRGTGCRPTTPDLALRTAIRRVRRPDVTINCSAPEAKVYESLNPVATFEVLSPSTRKTDTHVKLAEYMRHPTLRTIVLIDPDRMDVLVYTRTAESQWLDVRFDQPDQAVALTGVKAQITLAEIYDDVPLPAPEPRSVPVKPARRTATSRKKRV